MDKKCDTITITCNRACRESYRSRQFELGSKHENTRSTPTSSSNSSNDKKSDSDSTSFLQLNLELDKKKRDIQQPNVKIGDTDLNKVEGWYVPTDKEIIKGTLPHFKILPKDSQACIMAKTLFNQTIHNALNMESSGLELVAECIRIKIELEQTKKAIQKECSDIFKKDSSKIFISHNFYDEYLKSI